MSGGTSLDQPPYILLLAVEKGGVGARATGSSIWIRLFLLVLSALDYSQRYFAFIQLNKYTTKPALKNLKNYIL